MRGEVGAIGKHDRNLIGQPEETGQRTLYLIGQNLESIGERGRFIRVNPVAFRLFGEPKVICVTGILMIQDSSRLAWGDLGDGNNTCDSTSDFEYAFTKQICRSYLDPRIAQHVTIVRGF